jgi:hypothetical protein
VKIDNETTQCWRSIISSFVCCRMMRRSNWDVCCFCRLSGGGWVSLVYREFEDK